MATLIPYDTRTERLLLAGVVAVGALGGVAMAAAPFGAAPVLAVGAFAALLLMMQGQVRYILVLGLAITGFVHPEYQPVVFNLAGVDVRPFDCLMLVLMLVVAVHMAMGRLGLHAWVADLRQYAALWTWLAVVGASIGVVMLTIPERAPTAVVAYLRVLATAALVLVVPLAVRSPRQVRVMVWVLMVCSVITLFLAGLQRVGFMNLGQFTVTRARVGGLVGINALGIPSGFLGLWGVMLLFRPRPRRVMAALLIFCCLVGLGLAVSISSTLAFAATAGLYAVRHTRVNLMAPVKLAFIALVMVAGVAFFLVTFRSRDLQGLGSFNSGSSAHRSMLAYAAFQIWLRHPVFGVGWQGSATPVHMGSTELGLVLREKFPNMPDFYFPDHTVTTAHNFYMQMLAETGLIGVVALAWAIWRMRGRIRDMVAGIVDPRVREPAEFFQYGTLLVLIWWNTNPLYGGQTESIFVSALLGGLLAARRIAAGQGAWRAPERRRAAPGRAVRALSAPTRALSPRAGPRG